jgi:tryptophanyl-tRNA synthetase
MTGTRFMSGARPTGLLHVGQYFGAFRPAVEFSDRSGSFFVVSDLHMLTTRFTRQETERLKDHVLNLVATCIAFGISEDATTYYVQSEIPEHAQLYAIISSLIPYQSLLRHQSFEEMARHSGREASLGLLGYPVLEAADIIGMQASHVAVGEHNLSHLDMCRSIVHQLNEGWGTSLKVPATVTGLRNLVGADGHEKMSKSLNNAIFFRDEADEVRRKIREMAWIGDHGVVVPVEYLRALGVGSDGFLAATARRISAGDRPEEVKDLLLDAMETFLGPKRARIRELLAAPDYLLGLLRAGREKAREAFLKTHRSVVEAIGLPHF